MKIISQCRQAQKALTKKPLEVSHGRPCDTPTPGGEIHGVAVKSDLVAPWYNANIAAGHELRGLQPFTPVGIDPGTGEIITPEETDKPRANRLARFARQSAVRRLLPKSRTAKCLRLRQHTPKGQTDKEIEVWYSKEKKSAHYTGLQTCASPWACPVCSAKIAERRREEIKISIRKHEMEGGQVLLATFTNPHTRTDDLCEMVQAQAHAMRRFTGCRAVRGLYDDIGFVGSIRSWEVTHGFSNGWHPHFHVLLFVKTETPLEDIRLKLFEQWRNACRLAKLAEPSQERGVDLRDGSAASAYVSKGLWGLDQEITKGHIKNAKQGRRSPFQLIDSYMLDDDKQAGALFVEYAQAFHGKNQLTWSRGLKDHFAITEMNDEETAAVKEETAVLLGKIEFEEWLAVIRFDVRGDLLELARYGQWEPIRRLLDDLLTRSTKQPTNGKTL